jgi:hypothetical protein
VQLLQLRAIPFQKRKKDNNKNKNGVALFHINPLPLMMTHWNKTLGGRCRRRTQYEKRNKGEEE